jgi:hypothetical protein
MSQIPDEPQIDTPPVPPGPTSQVTIEKTEFDRLQAEARRATKALRDREAADESKRAQDAANAAAAAGEFNKALEIERAEKARLADQLALRDRKDSLQDEILRRNLSGSQARMLGRLVDVSGESFDPATAVEAVLAEYPDLFAPPAAPEISAPPVRRAGPVPPANPTSAPFAGYISPQEYDRFPHRVRLTPDFQQRVAASRPYWPTTFDARQLPTGNQ